MLNQQTLLKQPTSLLTPKPQQTVLLRASDALANLMKQTGMNTLVSCAAPLLAIMIQLKLACLTGKIKALRQHLLEAVVVFEVQANQLAMPKTTINSARYILCAALDEIILDQQLSEQAPWDKHNDWSKQSLVSTFYQDVWGGEKFFEVLEHSLQTAEQQLDLLELICFCLQLGFKGKYRIMEHGEERLALLQEKLYTIIQQYRAKSTEPVAVKNVDPTQKKWLPNPYILVLLTTGILGGTLVDLYLFFNQQLNTLVQPIYQIMHAYVAGV